MAPFVLELAPVVGLVAACAALAVSRATFYRLQMPPAPRHSRPAPPRALLAEERAKVLSLLNSQRFADKAPAQVYADLLDEAKYHCSVRTMYRILDASGEVRERRDQLRHAGYTKPELLATAPNQVWSWDITKLKGPTRWSYFSLYVLLDIFSRYVVGWLVSERENAILGHDLVRTACERQAIEPGQLTVHADRGSPMVAKSTALLYADLGIGKSHSRPHVSNDNPFSEAQFKTLKYRPEFPEQLPELDYPTHDDVLKVSRHGYIHIATIGSVRVTEALAEQPVGIREEDDGGFLVTFANIDLGIAYRAGSLSSIEANQSESN